MNNILKRVLYVSAIMVSLSLVPACTDEEWTKFERVDLEADGIDLEASYIDGYTATVPPEGATFTVTANGKRKEWGVLTGFSENGTTASWGLSYTVCAPDDEMPKGDWGNVVYLSREVPYSVRITVTPNKSSKTRELGFKFGFGYDISYLDISQEPLKK